MAIVFSFPRLMGLVAALALTLPAATMSSRPASAQAFDEAPYADNPWLYGRRLDGATLPYCVDRRDTDWEVAGAIADAIAAALLVEPKRYIVETRIISQDFEDIYQVMLEHCPMHMGFKLIPGGYPPWVTLSRPYYEAEYVFVTADPELRSLADLAPTRAIGATLGTAAHIQLTSYLRVQPIEKRWPTYPYGTNELALASLLNGTVDVALVWAPDLWARQQADPAYADLRIIDPAPLQPTGYGVGALLLANETFLRTAVDEAITALTVDGTIQSILDEYGFLAKAPSSTDQ